MRVHHTTSILLYKKCKHLRGQQKINYAPVWSSFFPDHLQKLQRSKLVLRPAYSHAVESELAEEESRFDILERWRTGLPGVQEGYGASLQPAGHPGNTRLRLHPWLCRSPLWCRQTYWPQVGFGNNYINTETFLVGQRGSQETLLK